VNEADLASVLERARAPVAQRVVGDTSVVVRDITHDSRAVTPGAIFCCIRGDHVDGHLFAEEAVDAGASALVVDHQLGLDVAQVLVDDVRAAAGPLAAAVFDHPSDRLTIVGVTGTNGKTTTTHLLAAVMEAAGLPCGIIGTLSGVHTTPEAPDLQRRLAELADEGMRAVAMEVSSHALALRRVDGTRFAAAVFTNLGRDHLDLHGTQERYFAAKARLFEPALSALGVVNVDDVYGRLLADAASIAIVGFSLDELTDVQVTATRHSYRWRDRTIAVPIGGGFNVANSLAAATTAEALGIDRARIAEGLAVAPAVPGRFESIDAGQPFAVIVDYAHTPDGLRSVLDAAREVAGGHQVIVVFGCGGDRDAEKRPLMGQAAVTLADLAVITSDNPRSEDPLEIIAAVLSGVPPEYRRRAVVEPDRRAAIAEALAAALPGDVVVVAGKGHEATQTTGTTVTPFDDRVVVRELLETPT
jgi:UDP-N-acetylmuramoyl-L-alanyl-D-glutamate--2,6-diaminopimelate ligase